MKSGFRITNKGTVKLFFLWLLLFTTGHLFAQQTPLKHYTVEDGLPSNTVYSMIRDTKGFLWFATDKGICRFDGVTFRSYNTLDGLSDNDVLNIQEDYEGRLWFATYNGSLCFLKDGVFYSEKNTPWLKLKVKAPIFRLYLQSDSSITFVVDDSPYFISIKGDKMTIIPFLKENTFFIRKNIDGSYWILLFDRVVNIDSVGNILNIKYHKLNKRYSFFKSLSITSKDEYLIASKKGIYSTDEKFLYPVNPKLNDVFPCPIKTKDDNLLLGLLDGVNINNKIDLKINKFVTFIESDTSGNFWFCTKGSGVYLMSKYFKGISEYKNVYANQIVYGRMINNSPYFVNDHGKLYRLDKEKITSPVAGIELMQDELFLTRSNFLLAANGDFFRFFYGEFQYYKNDKDKYTPFIKKAVSRDFSLIEPIKEIFFGGSYIYIAKRKEITRILYDVLLKGNDIHEEKVVKSQDHNNGRIFHRAWDSENNTLWYATADKMFKYEHGASVFQPQFGKYTFRQFHFFRHYVVGYTEKNKLLIFNNYNSVKVGVDSVNDNCIWEHIYPIDETRAIISTNSLHRLLTLLPPSPAGRPRYKIQTLENSFIPIQVDYIIADTEKCYFFKGGHVTEVSTSVLFEEEAPPIPLFASLKVGKRKVAIKSEINLSYQEAKNIIITIDKISFASKDIFTQYSISDKPEEDNWVTLDGHDINLNNLSFGRHWIKIRAKTLSTPFSKPVVLELSVSAPFWATWWFIAVVVVGLILVVWLAVVLLSRQRIRKQERAHQADMKYQQSEYKALNALMNPHFIFNSLNNIQGLINKNDKRVANEYLVIFSDLIRQNMNNISKGFITLQEELTLVENYLNLEQLRFKEYINYSITVEEDVETDMILIPPLMIQPLVENAVKHGLLPRQSTDNAVKINVFESQDKLYIEIDDNGVGLTYANKNKSNLHESFGLSNLQKRAEHLKKIQKQEINVQVSELLDDQGKVLGTRAIVTMDLK